MRIFGKNSKSRMKKSQLNWSVKFSVMDWRNWWLNIRMNTRIMFYKERSKVMYSCQFWFLYSRSLICTLLFVQSFLKLKFRFSRSFKEFFFINMFIRKNLHYIYSLLKTGNITNYNRIIIRRIKCIFSYILAIFL